MSRRCVVTGKGVLSGNNVSHALNRTRRRFLPSVAHQNVYSEALKRLVPIKVSNAGLRTLEHKGGFDVWVMETAPAKLDPALRRIRTQVMAAVAADAAK
jgi:large subunit ribosomal protein L28